MRRADRVEAKGHWDAADQSASVTLPFSERHRRRIRLQDDAGEAFLLDLVEARLLRGGDGLVTDRGVIAVQAAAEPVATLSCRDAVHCARLAWHLGNRHLSVQVIDEVTLRISQDHVIEAMCEGLGAEVERHEAAFEPEGGAYHSHD
ncbi:MAG: urease accessory protein UreE [Magnetovibrionaceae bacterium]